MNEIDFIESMEVLEYQEGDIIILKVKGLLSANNKTHIRQSIDEIIEPQKKGVKVMILDDGADIGILRKGAL